MLMGSFESIAEEGGIAAIMKTSIADKESMWNKKVYSILLREAVVIC